MSDVERRDASEDDRAGELPRPFGPFTLIGHLGSGGMGDVYVAQREGIAGIAKRCVVKTLRPGFSDDREYVTRFLDEARIVVQLHHKNICPVYDVGRADGRHYLAMEYIAGRDLRLVWSRAIAHSALHPGLALFIVSEMLEALDYAHRLVGDDDTPLMLVHRDVSPHNVMIGFEGDVRLIDFGLAASTLKLEHTAPTVVMGKVAYMAPEHVCGEKLDGRADQFAAAVTAYELLAGERFYEGRPPREVYQLAAQGGFRPAGFEDLPPPLKSCLGRALSIEKKDRFDSCGAMREEIESFRFSSGLRGDAPALRGLMHELFAEELAIEKSMLSRGSSSSAAAARPPADAVSVSAPTRAAQRSDPSGRAVEDSSGITGSTPIVRERPDAETLALPAAPDAPRNSKLVAAAAVVVAVAAVVVAVVAVRALPGGDAPPVAAPPAAAPPVNALPAAPPAADPPSPAPGAPGAPGGSAATDSAATDSAATDSASPGTPAAPSAPVEAGSAATRAGDAASSSSSSSSSSAAASAPKHAAEARRAKHPRGARVHPKSADGRPAATAPPRIRIDWLASRCPKLACTASLRAHRDDYATLSDAAFASFMKDLAGCYGKCR